MHPIARPSASTAMHKRQRRIDAARQAHDHAREAVFVDVVARALHERAVDALLLRLQGHDLARHGLHPARAVDAQFDRDTCLR